MAGKPEVADQSDKGQKERAPFLCAWRALEPGSIQDVETPRGLSRSSVEESFHSSSHFLNIISDY